MAGNENDTQAAGPADGRRAGITDLCGVPSLARLKKYHCIPHFKLGGHYAIGDESAYEFGGEGGRTLESLGAGPLRTAYIAVGNPERDAAGRIVNAVIISPYYTGDAAWCYEYWFHGRAGTEFSKGPVVGPGCLIDTDRFYVVFLDSVGIWGGSKPSDGLGMRFPPYSIFDCVQANYRLLRDELNVGRVVLATGVSGGGSQSYVWAVLHPDFVGAILPIGGTTNTADDPVVRWIFQLMTEAMKSDPVWWETKGDYYHLPKDRHPNRGMMFGWSILMHNGLDLDFRLQQGWPVVQREVFFWEPQGDQGLLLLEKAHNYDVNDLIIRNATQDTYTIDDHLPGIRAKTLVLHVSNDLWLRVTRAEASARKIPGAGFASFAGPLGHYAVFRAPNVLRKEVEEFLKEVLPGGDIGSHR